MERKVHLLGSCRKCQRQNKLNYCVRMDLVAYLNTASRQRRGGRQPRGREEITREDGAVWREQKYIPLSLRTQLRGLHPRSSGCRGGPGPGPGPGTGWGRGGGGGPSPGAVNFSWAAACQPQKALKVQQPAPASAAAFVRVIYDFNLGSPRVHTAFAAVEG